MQMVRGDVSRIIVAAGLVVLDFRLQNRRQTRAANVSVGKALLVQK